MPIILLLPFSNVIPSFCRLFFLTILLYLISLYLISYPLVFVLFQPFFKNAFQRPPLGIPYSLGKLVSAPHMPILVLQTFNAYAPSAAAAVAIITTMNPKRKRCTNLRQKGLEKHTHDILETQELSTQLMIMMSKFKGAGHMYNRSSDKHGCRLTDWTLRNVRK